MTWRTPKAFVLIVATLACAAALGSLALAYPRTVTNPALDLPALGTTKELKLAIIPETQYLDRP